MFWIYLHASLPFIGKNPWILQCQGFAIHGFCSFYILYQVRGGATIAVSYCKQFLSSKLFYWIILSRRPSVQCHSNLKVHFCCRVYFNSHGGLASSPYLSWVFPHWNIVVLWTGACQRCCKWGVWGFYGSSKMLLRLSFAHLTMLSLPGILATSLTMHLLCHENTS